MRGILYILFINSLIFMGAVSTPGEEISSWQSPFDSSLGESNKSDSVLTLRSVLNMVSLKNPTFKALSLREQASFNLLKQAGLWSNPEFGADYEEVGWDAPGFSESELTVTLSQEFELFGQRSARKQVAQAEIYATHLQTKLSAYDLYLETKRRFYTLVHARRRLKLTRFSLELANGIVENINFRISKGAALQSESLLAQLEKQRVQLKLGQAEQEVASSEISLVSLWNGTPNDLTVTLQADSEPTFNNLMPRIAILEHKIDSSRTLLQLRSQSALLRAEASLAVAEARPTITLNGGYKRLEGNNSNSFVFGISTPLPFFNRNQGTQASLKAQSRSLQYEMERTRLEVLANIRSGIIQLQELIRRHKSLDTLLLPTAESAYQTLQTTYEAGRVSYVQLLEAERSLNEIRFEHNDMLLAIHEQIIALESLTGITLRIDKE